MTAPQRALPPVERAPLRIAPSPPPKPLGVKVSKETSCRPCYFGDHEKCRKDVTPTFGNRRTVPCTCLVYDHALGQETCAKAIGTGWHERRCDRAVAEVIMLPPWEWSGTRQSKRDPIPTPVCGQHLGGAKRSAKREAENAARRKAELDAVRQEESWRRERRAAAEDAAAYLQSLGLDDLHVTPDGRLAIQPERLIDLVDGLYEWDDDDEEGEG